MAIRTATDQETCGLASCAEGFAWYLGYIMVEEEVAFLKTPRQVGIQWMIHELC